MFNLSRTTVTKTFQKRALPPSLAEALQGEGRGAKTLVRLLVSPLR